MTTTKEEEARGRAYLRGVEYGRQQATKEILKLLKKYVNEDMVFYEGDDEMCQDELKEDLIFFMKQQLQKLNNQQNKNLNLSLHAEVTKNKTVDNPKGSSLSNSSSKDLGEKQ